MPSNLRLSRAAPTFRGMSWSRAVRRQSCSIAYPVSPVVYPVLQVTRDSYLVLVLVLVQPEFESVWPYCSRHHPKKIWIVGIFKFICTHYQVVRVPLGTFPHNTAQNTGLTCFKWIKFNFIPFVSQNIISQNWHISTSTVKLQRLICICWTMNGQKHADSNTSGLGGTSTETSWKAVCITTCWRFAWLAWVSWTFFWCP